MKERGGDAEKRRRCETYLERTQRALAYEGKRIVSNSDL